LGQILDQSRTSVIGETKMNNSLVKYCKFLSLLLRHNPDAAGITLDHAGWADVNEILSACEARGFPKGLEVLQEVVDTNEKQRFGFSQDGSKIRARQGHSIAVDIGLQAITPPVTLYHGTADRFVTSILTEGIQSGRRQHVHLSVDIATARKVGQRHGRPVILKVDAAGMHQEGYAFFCSDNGVWLTNEVPIRFVSELDSADLVSKSSSQGG